MRFLWIIVLASVAACSGSSATCDDAAAHLESLFGPNNPMLRDLVTTHCREDAWSASARDCIARAGSRGEVAGCRGALGAAGTKLFVAITDVMKRLQQVQDSPALAPAGIPAEVAATKLPIAPAPRPLGDSLVLDVSATTITLAGKPFTDADLDALFRAAYARDKDTQVVIRATTKDIAHARIVAIMERAKAAGITRLAIGTAP